MYLRDKGIEYLIIHHTAGNEVDTEAVRQIHLNMGWGDVGYNSIIEKSGVVGVGRDIKYAVAHDVGYIDGRVMNEAGYGLACIGNFENEQMTEVQYQSLLKEAQRVRKLYNIPVEKVRRHGDHYATKCPGKNFPWERFISDLRKPIIKSINPHDIYLSVRVLDYLAEQAIKDINKLGFAAKRMDLA